MKYETDSLNVGNCHVTLESETLRDKAAREMLCAMLANPAVVDGCNPGSAYNLARDDSRTKLCSMAYMLADDLAEAGKELKKSIGATKR